MNHKPLLLTVAEVAELLRIQRAKVYILIEAKVVDAFKIGSDWRVRCESVEKLIGEVPDEFFKGPGSKSRSFEIEQRKAA